MARQSDRCPRKATFLTSITERNGADLQDMTAGHALWSFACVWSSHAPDATS
jgi:hypothetical protein